VALRRSLGAVRMAGQHLVKAIEHRIGDRVVDVADPDHDDRAGAHQARLHGRVEREVFAGPPIQVERRQRVHLRMGDEGLGEQPGDESTLEDAVAAPGDDRAVIVDQHAADAKTASGPGRPRLLEGGLPGLTDGLPCRDYFAHRTVRRVTGRSSRTATPDAPVPRDAMSVFDPEVFVAECQAALGGPQPMLAVKDILERAVAQPDEVASGLRADPGVAVLHRSPALTVISVVIPAGSRASLPHDHRMWALVGIYGGQEDNQFFRRADGGLEESGGRSLAVSDTLAMGDDTIHAIQNPLGHSALAAVHVYGGDLVGAARSMWTLPGYDEQPYEDTAVLGAPMRQ
jgi:predicted metal-dependent enzyme (double-stranded beta helix superfamily)